MSLPTPIYDCHVPAVEKLLALEPQSAPTFHMDEAVTDFYRFTRDSFSLGGLSSLPFDDEIPCRHLSCKGETPMFAIAAVSQNWGIGKIITCCSASPPITKRFRELTEGKPC